MSKLTQEEMANLPPALRKQAEEMEAQARQAQEAIEAAAESNNPPVEGQEQPTTHAQVTNPEQAPTPVQNTADAALRDEGTPQRKPVTSLDQAEQALRVLQGKYDREITRVHAENRELRESVKQLSEKVETVKAQAPAKKDETYAELDISDPDNFYGLTEDESDLGPEVLSVAQKVGKKLADEAIGRAMEPIRKQLEQQAARQQDQEASKFWADLEGLSPGWEAVNEMPEFVEWLRDVQTGTMQTRKRLLNDAYQERDARTAAYYFQQFMSETGRSKPKASKNVMEQVVPRRGTATPTAQQKQWSLDEWSKAHKKLAVGDPNSLQIQELSKELKAAWDENRVSL